jgi:hypothetical protein
MPQRQGRYSVPRIGSILRQRLFFKQRKPQWDVTEEQHLADAGVSVSALKIDLACAPRVPAAPSSSRPCQPHQV